MGKLAETAGTKALKGPVTMTNLDDGTSQTFPDEAAAEKALPSGAQLEHKRGAFFYKAGGKPRSSGRKPKPADSDD